MILLLIREVVGDAILAQVNEKVARHVDEDVDHSVVQARHPVGARGLAEGFDFLLRYRGQG